METDVIIVGGGIAGITTAIELLSFNKKVLLVERGTEANFGGLAQWSFGGVFFAGSPTQKLMGIKDTPELAFQDWLNVAEFESEDILPKKWAEAYVYNSTPKTYYWLKEQGVKIFPVVHWVERGLYGPGNSYPRFHMVWGTGWELSKRLESSLKNHPKAKGNLKIVYDHRVEEIITKGGGIEGIRGKNELTGTDFQFNAPTVVIATGGFGGNIEKVRENWYKPWGAPPEILVSGSTPFADGLLHDATEKINGAVTHLDHMFPYAAGIHHPKPRHPDHGLSIVPPRSALWLNYKGERIGPKPLLTSFDTRYLVEQICKQEKKYSWQVLNKKIMLKEFAISGSEHNAAIRDKKLFKFVKTVLFGNKELVDDMLTNCIDMVVADSLDELVKKMNVLNGTNDVDANTLKTEIRKYDANIARGKKYHNDDQLRHITQLRQYTGDKLRTCNFQQIEDPNAKPYIAIREFILSRKTLGGIQTDLQSRVTQKNTDQNKPDVIPGLYAVGECAGFGGGGMLGKSTLEGAFLGGCVFSARVAAHSIAGKNLY